jgi:pimeloyl-ACP methyl ester carboxylesterase
MAEIKSFALNIDGRRVRLWRGGRGQTLTLLHAGGGDAQLCWERIWNDLGECCEIIAPDWPGFGESESMPRTTYQDLGGWIESLRRALGVEKFSLVGNSFGGTMAGLYRAKFPEYVHTLVMINGGAFVQSGRAADSPITSLLASGKIKGPDELAREMQKLMFHDQSLLTPEFTARLSAGTGDDSFNPPAGHVRSAPGNDDRDGANSRALGRR